MEFKYKEKIAEISRKEKEKKLYQRMSLIFLSMTLVAVAVTLLVFMFPPSPERAEIVLESALIQDQKAWERIFSENDNYEFTDSPLGVILPNDQLTYLNLTKFYKGLAEVRDPELIIFLGTEPKKAGYELVEVCEKCMFLTPGGVLNESSKLAEELIEKEIAYATDEIFENYEVFTNHSPFLMQFFPRAKVLPIMINGDIHSDDLVILKKWIDDQIGMADTMVVLGTNFANFVPKNIADFHDLTAVNVVESFDYEQIRDLDVDSSSALELFLKIMDEHGYSEAEIIEFGNSEDFIDEKNNESTSHGYFAFYEGGKTDNIGRLSMIVTGKVYDSSLLNFNEYWEFAEVDYDTEILGQLRDLDSEEARFFKGIDLRVFDFEETGCFETEKNGFNLAFCSYIENIEGDYEEELAEIEELNDRNDLVYLEFGFNGGEINEDREEFVSDFTDEGVDIFVGQGLTNKVLPMQYDDGTLIFYSIGDFLTDNKLVNELTSNSSGLILGLYLTEDEIQVRTYPIEIVNGYPKLLNLVAAREFFTEFVSQVSFPRNTEYRFDADSGIITVER